MRLLEWPDTPGGSPTFAWHDEKPVPPYAILSHTWGAEADEVSFQDLTDGTGQAKVGYDKLRFCANQARQDGLRFFWVDTCCINKTNSSELNESINSMFRWYRNAARCYVYLADFDGISSDGADFRGHRWFTRGWTLQELVAPASVEFFTSKGTRIGDRDSLKELISRTTGISVVALRGSASLSDFDSEAKFKWAEKRQTKKEEDWAYCLLGIFGVYMPLIYGEGRESALRRLKKEISAAVADPSDAPRRRTPWIVPFDRNPYFSSRETELMQLGKKLFRGDYTSRVAVTGLGGAGKTQLVLELLYRTRTEYSHCSVLWITATSKERLEQDYLDAAKQLGIPGCRVQGADAKRLMRDYLSSEEAGQWLLVFDNADQINMWTAVASTEHSDRLIDFLPRSSRGSIIFTTRDVKAAVTLAGQEVVEITEMDAPGGMELLGKSLRVRQLIERQEEYAKALLSRLTYLPLAIIQAAMYINSNGIDIRGYLSLMEDQESVEISLLSEDFEDKGRYRELENPVAITWLITFEHIRQHNRIAADFLSFLACTDFKDIPLSMLPSEPSPVERISALGTLRGYSFITMNVGDEAMSLHRLVHLATRNWLRKEGLLSVWTERVRARLAVLLGNVDEVKRREWRSYMPHASYILAEEGGYSQGVNGPHLGLKSRPEEAVNGDDEFPESHILTWRYVLCLHKEGKYSESEAHLKRLLAWAQENFRESHGLTRKCTAQLAGAYASQGRLSEAEALQLRLVEVCTKEFGAGHFATLRHMYSLANTYLRQGRFDEAEVLQLKVLDGAKVESGDHSNWALQATCELAWTYRCQERFGEAEKLYLRALEDARALLGEHHSVTQMTMGNLATVYRNMGQLDKAEELLVQAWELHKTILGEHHPSTLLVMAKFASLYQLQNRLDEAERIGAEVLDATKRVRGSDNPHTIHCMHIHACTLWQQGRNDDAKGLMQDCLDISQRMLGTDHPDTTISRQTLKAWRAKEELPHEP